MKAGYVLSLFLGLVLMVSAAMATESDHAIPFDKQTRVALIGNSLGERFNLFGHFETQFHLRTPNKRIQLRNFCWPGDEVGIRQRPSNYTKIDNPITVFSPNLYFCFFGANESYRGT
ncbi:MAG: hypothetical protein AAF664_25735, partial [Planctomycetota bacterium]